MGELRQAVERLQCRKEAAGVTDQQRAPEEAVRAVIAEFDLDLEEMLEVRRRVAESGLRASQAGFSPIEIIDATWVDGLVTGYVFEHIWEPKGRKPGVRYVLVSEPGIAVNEAKAA